MWPDLIFPKTWFPYRSLLAHRKTQSLHPLDNPNGKKQNDFSLCTTFFLWNVFLFCFTQFNRNVTGHFLTTWNELILSSSYSNSITNDVCLQWLTIVCLFAKEFQQKIWVFLWTRRFFTTIAMKNDFCCIVRKIEFLVSCQMWKCAYSVSIPCMCVCDFSLQKKSFIKMSNLKVLLTLVNFGGSKVNRFHLRLISKLKIFDFYPHH